MFLLSSRYLTFCSSFFTGFCFLCESLGVSVIKFSEQHGLWKVLAGGGVHVEDHLYGL